MRKPTISAWSERFIGILALLLLYALVTVGQSLAAEETETISSETIDEITVYGERSIIVLQKEFDLAQVRMFDLFNTLNSDDEFDIECDYEQRIGSRRWHHVCTPKFATRQAAHEGAVFLRRNKQTGEVQAVTHHNRRMDKKLWAEMAVLVNANPELRKAFEELTKAKNAIDAERQKRRND
ncbi:MAG: hypothetical protein OEM63_06010 [Gammaproteobacteria bacterium]|nr:hypothetical protein [Gammaproteobacteria bacterium]